MKKSILLLTLTAMMITSMAWAQSQKPAKLPAEKAGKISAPMGQIAFVRDKDLWVMNWDGMNQFKVVTAQNAEGGISWSPDGKRIAFTRKGQFEYQGPSFMDGGRHALYDIFIGYIDSALNQNTGFWRQISFHNGARSPIWSNEGDKIYCTFDKNANTVNSMFANYQTAVIDTFGAEPIIFRADTENVDSLLAIMPTIGPDGMYAFGIIEKTQKKGIGISALNAKSLKKADFGNSIKLMEGVTAPSWSPDGKWIAFIDEDMSSLGIFITNPELTEKYLVFKPGPGQLLQTYTPSWSPDSKWITFGQKDGSLWIIDITGNGLRQLTGPGINTNPTWSKHK